MTTSKSAAKRRVKSVAKRGNAAGSKASKGNRLAGRKPDPKLHVRKRVAAGATGTVVGAAIAGPIGAVVGGVLGTVVGVAAETVPLKSKGASPRAAKRAGKGTPGGKKRATTATRKPAAS